MTDYARLVLFWAIPLKNPVSRSKTFDFELKSRVVLAVYGIYQRNLLFALPPSDLSEIIAPWRTTFGNKIGHCSHSQDVQRPVERVCCHYSKRDFDAGIYWQMCYSYLASFVS